MKALLFINGEPPKNIPEISQYDLIACTDGAIHYLKEKKFPLEKLDFISGDFDSYKQSETELSAKLIHTPDQNKTDFHKALEITIEEGIYDVDVYGGSGGEQDHYLGNLTVAYLFRNKIKITFYDEYSRYFFIPEEFEIRNVLGKMISLVPYPVAENVVTKGLNWPLFGEELSMTGRIGTRNFAVEDTFTCTYTEGAILVFIGK
ncbi:thiamine pyrophosphokinase [Elizabethkingia meningoseptica]|uniref:thiamine diphosphokinase n=1 Tax=Elizabethkingia meningoseptica TaxID=238 RepID=UPI000332D4E4|nr:thiamine diphosphokinase [Elizabethkingia meningoseptica]AQX05000.1 thiamine pyrophosphokinase [Elizabethkingia meningoseptica]AQX47041.1 thiamine pyrophosphokinase [Elizabethkingia meningoseptica]EOR29151.1 Thiamin pyrophosphokinase [Elizabethkingia meningoseptica ATCC 13253 = NBRC 12535]KUY17984.1 thiamine pyrophosphokinase [Elizabethkingia meningoseptica]MDE5489096.1 thiamine diphosphokinase [Elizabethkingia meningoseptica]